MAELGFGIVFQAVLVVLAFALFCACWQISKKMGGQGWELFVPIYNVFFLCDRLYSSGWKILLFLIPIYNIIFGILICFDLAKAFAYKKGFAWGILFMTPLFLMIMGFDGHSFRDGRLAVKTDDFIFKMSNAMRLRIAIIEKQNRNRAEELGIDTENPLPKTAPEGACPNCGVQNEPNAAFCIQCGSPLKADAVSDGCCPKCGTKNDPDAVFCVNCGNKLK